MTQLKSFDKIYIAYLTRATNLLTPHLLKSVQLLGAKSEHTYIDWQNLLPYPFIFAVIGSKYDRKMLTIWYQYLCMFTLDLQL